jgi:hypothetical protein
MKLEIKKIALVMAAGIFAISSLAANMEMTEMANEAGAQDTKFKNIKVINELKGRTVDIKINDKLGAEKRFAVEKAGNKVEAIPGGNLETLDIFVDKGQGMERREINIDLAREKGKRAIAKRIKDRVQQELKNRGISITAEVEGDTLVITIKRTAEMEDIETPENMNGLVPINQI